MNDKLKPALIGGVILGVLSAIPAVNYCCCIWALVGGLIAANLYIKSSPNPVAPADGAVVGALAGVVGVVLIVVIGIPLQLVLGTALMSVMQGVMQNADPRQAEQFREAMAASGGITIFSAIKGALITGVTAVIFSAVGGLLGVALFEKRKGGPGVPPPPPPQAGGPGGYGTPGGGGYGTPGTGGGYGQPGGGGGYGQNP
ncbi:MAG TPA: hypothetical protein VF591_19150 [Pyrinomonadaceae bacterium]|jgi:hypothetical protein